MDSITQATLGAAVGEAVLGRQLGWRAMVLGGIVGTLPDLDILLYPFLDEIAKLYWHRGLSHSMLFTILVSPILGWLIGLRFRSFGVTKPRATLFVFLVWSTHVLIDCFTTYGTQIYEPFSSERFSFHIFFIIDPLYTLPLLLGLIIALFFPRESLARRRINGLGLILSSLYVVWAFTAKAIIEPKFERAFADNGISPKRYFTTPTPFNTILWRCLAEDDEGYWSGYYSLLDPDADIQFRRIERRAELMPPDVSQSEAAETARWFSEDYYQVTKTAPGEWILSDLRLGEYPRRDQKGILQYDTVLAWKLSQQEDGTVQFLTQWSEERGGEKILQRIWARMLGEKDALTRP